MRAASKVGGWLGNLSNLVIPKRGPDGLASAPASPRIGLALGGGFARGIAHAGVLEVFERYRIPIHCITGVSAGSIVAAAYASGASPAEIARAGCAMRFGDVARWSISRMGFVVNERMRRFLERLLKRYRFEEMRIPLGVVATDLVTGKPICFRDKGDVFLPVRASCAYPGLFQPVVYEGRSLVDGAISMEIPAVLARQLGATHVISVHLPAAAEAPLPRNVFQVVNRCIQILQTQTEESWRKDTDLIITPDVCGVNWDGFESGPDLLKAGELAALTALPRIQAWMKPQPVHPLGKALPGSTPARSAEFSR
ncbi:MAG TPA: patatin-like phospholipase family protein [Candidatus Acidoferrales bacterium]|jgi:NTE family protein|nr:patatin-like phospholipase family protein [Candidatus Acidoferrales bacterium]